MKPIIVINLKTYKQGKNILDLIKKIEKVDKKIIIGVQATDIFQATQSVKNPIYSEHVDYFKPGRNTGFIIPEAVKKEKAKGVFLNHSEHKIKFGILKKTIKRCRDVKLKTAVFAASLSEAKKIEKLHPDYLIYEPPELVAGNISVSKAKSELLEKISKKLKMPFLVGAGIKTKEDIDIAMKKGAAGIAFSSVITKAKNPEKTLRNLIE